MSSLCCGCVSVPALRIDARPSTFFDLFRFIGVLTSSFHTPPLVLLLIGFVRYGCAVLVGAFFFSMC